MPGSTLRATSSPSPDMPPVTLPTVPKWVRTSAIILFILAIGLRFYHIDEPAMEFMGMRQYRAALIARDINYRTDPLCPSWKKAIASANAEKAIEPPISEYAAVMLYRLLGKEDIAYPRMLASCYWVVAGIFLFLLLLRFFAPFVALFGSAFLLFLPGAYTATRSFQPEPLMVMLTIICWYLLVRYDEQPTLSRLLAAALVGALAILVKVQALFFVYPFFLGLALARYPTYRTRVTALLKSPATYQFIGITILPVLVYYLSGLMHTKMLLGAAQTISTPQVIFTSMFWFSWLESLGRVMGYYPLVIAVLGIILVTDTRLRLLQYCLWIGYLLYMLAFSYGAATHQYYQLPFLPVAALSLCPLLQLTLPSLQRHNTANVKPVVLVLFWVALSINIIFALDTLAHPEYVRTAEAMRELGETVNHSTRVISLTSDYGMSLKFYGELCCQSWPITADFTRSQWMGDQVANAEDRFKGMLPQADYFAVTDPVEFSRQPELGKILTQNYPVIKQTQDYILFDLRQRKQGKKP